MKSNFHTYICIVCGFIYDEAAGRPEDGISAGTVWASVPESWECPDCGVSKSDFEMIEIWNVCPVSDKLNLFKPPSLRAIRSNLELFC